MMPPQSIFIRQSLYVLTIHVIFEYGQIHVFL